MAKQASRRMLLLSLGPVVGVIIGAISNLLTSRWNWWLFSILALLVAVAVVVAVALDEGTDGKRRAGSAALPYRHLKRVPRVNTLPRDIDDFTGRLTEISLLLAMTRRAAAAGRAAVCSVEGIGGVGKTSLVVHVAYKIAKNYPDAVLFIDLRSHADGLAPVSASEALAILLSDLGVPGENVPESLEGRASLWRRELSDARALVILDNVNDADQVGDLLAGGCGCLFIITSRQRLIEIAGASSLTLENLSPGDAATLFARVLGADPQGQERADITEVVERLGGLPLAIRLTAARLRAHPARTVHDLLGQDVRQHTNLEHVYSLSYRDLAPGLRSFFRLLSIHPGAEITAAVAAVLTCTQLDVASVSLEELYNRYLLTEPAPHRFRFHDLIKDFASRESSVIDDEATRQGALRRLLGYYAFTAESASGKIGMDDLFTVPPPALNGNPPLADDRAALSWFDAELSNLLSCASLASQQALLPFAWQLPASMTYYLRIRGLLGEAVTLLDTALVTLEHEADPAGEAIVRRRIGQIARLQGNLILSRSQLDRSMQITRNMGDQQGLAWCHQQLGHLERADGRAAAARSHFTRALTINRDLGNPAGIASAELNLGVLLRIAGDTENARAFLGDALRIYSESRDRRGKASALYKLGALERDCGNYQSAREKITEALEIYEEVGNHHGQAECYLNLAVIDRLSGNYEQSRKRSNEALGIYEKLGYRQGEAETHAELAATAQAEGNHTVSLAHQQRTDSIYALIRPANGNQDRITGP
jgi:tetratricopeptide (TPR) repeat protein